MKFLHIVFTFVYSSVHSTMSLANSDIDSSKCSMEYYLQKTYYKTSSLISNSCKAVAILAGHTAEVSVLAYEYGRNLVCGTFLIPFSWIHFHASYFCKLGDNLANLVHAGSSLPVNWWCSWFHRHLCIPWEGFIVWYSPRENNYLSFFILFTSQWLKM